MKLNDKVYVINLFINIGINSTFNIECLVDYNDLDVIPLVDKSSHEPIFESPSFHHYQIFYPIQHVKLINS